MIEAKSMNETSTEELALSSLNRKPKNVSLLSTRCEALTCFGLCGGEAFLLFFVVLFWGSEPEWLRTSSIMWSGKGLSLTI